LNLKHVLYRSRAIILSRRILNEARMTKEINIALIAKSKDISLMSVSRYMGILNGTSKNMDQNWLLKYQQKRLTKLHCT